MRREGRGRQKEACEKQGSCLRGLRVELQGLEMPLKSKGIPTHLSSHRAAWESQACGSARRLHSTSQRQESALAGRVTITGVFPQSSMEPRKGVVFIIFILHSVSSFLDLSSPD